MLKYEFFFYFWPAHPKGLGISGIGRELKSKSVMHSTHSILSINASVIQGVRKSGRQPRPAVVRASTHIPQSVQNYNNSILINTLPTQPPHLFTNLIFVFNIASGSEAKMTTLCEMEFFDFLWLILVHYTIVDGGPVIMAKIFGVFGTKTCSFIR